MKLEPHEPPSAKCMHIRTIDVALKVQCEDKHRVIRCTSAGKLLLARVRS